MVKKLPVSFAKKFPHVDPLAFRLLQRLLAFDPRDRPSAEEALADPYFYSLADLECEPSTKPISKFEFEFEKRKLTKDHIRELIYREILEYHPQMLQEYLGGVNHIHFLYPSGVDRFRQQFAHLEEHYSKGERSNTPLRRQYASVPRERICALEDEPSDESIEFEKHMGSATARTSLQSPTRARWTTVLENSPCKQNYNGHGLFKSPGIRASKCVS